MLGGKLKLACRAAYLYCFGEKANLVTDYDAASKTYDDYYSKHLAKASTPYVDKIPIAPAASMADMACGTGFFTHILAAKVAPEGRVMAVDVSAGMLQQNKLGAQQKGLDNIQFQQADALEFLATLESGSLDVLNIGWGMCYMNHTQLMQAASRVLRPGGYLSIIENRSTTLGAVSKLFERVLAKYPQALQKHVKINLPKNSRYLEKTVMASGVFTRVEAYDSQVVIQCKQGQDIADYMLRSGASAGFVDALDSRMMDSVMHDFAQLADSDAQHGKPVEVIHEYCVLIARRV